MEHGAIIITPFNFSEMLKNPENYSGHFHNTQLRESTPAPNMTTFAGSPSVAFYGSLG